MQPYQAPSAPYDMQARYTLCLTCGAVLPVPVQGGAVVCGACSTQAALGPRETRPVHVLAPHPVTPDPQRVQQLRAQDGRPMQAPPSLQSLMHMGDIPAWKKQEAFAAWQGSRRELQATGSYDAAERLAFLTLFLPQGDDSLSSIQKRAFHEAALDIMTVPRHRQLVLGQIARLAAREGDLRSGEAWLALCDPNPDELDMDSTYRATRAMLDTQQGRFANVLQVLGNGPDDIPIADFMDGYCGVLRANAWERLGRVDVAVQLLEKELQRNHEVVEAMAKKYGLCAQSHPAAHAQHEHASAEASAHTAGGGIGNVLLLVAVPQMLIGIVLIGGGLLGYLGFLDAFGMGSGSLSDLAGPMFGGVVMMVISAGLVLWGLSARKQAARARHLRLHGTPATAQVTQCGRTGTVINNVPQWDIHLSVQLPGRPPYAASVRMVMTDAAIARLQGATVRVRVDPNKPTDLVLQQG